MRVEHVPCGQFVNASEERAYQHLSRKLIAEPGDARFVILTNVAHSVSGGGQADEIDIVLIGPTGVHVVEVKHWDRVYVRSNRDVVAAEADKMALKARKIASKIRRRYPNLGYIVPKMLLTKEQKTLQRDTDEPIRGVRLYAFPDWRILVELEEPNKLPETLIDRLCAEIAPLSRGILSGDLRRLGQIADLALLSPRDDRFHRVYRGRNTVNQDQVVVHVYDLSASEHENPAHLARREFEVVQRMQKSPWLPRLVDSFQPLPHYPGELFFFSVADSCAPTLRARARDMSWRVEDRMEFANHCLAAFDELHRPAGDEVGVIHRTVTPDAILVRPDGAPLFFHWEWARMPEAQTIAPVGTGMVVQEFAAPEVLAHGLSAADRRSDVYALCASLKILFGSASFEEVQQADQAKEAMQVLALGTAADPGERSSLVELADLLVEIRRKPATTASEALEAERPAQTWAEEAVVQVDGHHYRVLGRLGTGGTGRTFKVEQFDPTTDEGFGTYVAKVVSNKEVGAKALGSYKLARPHTKHANLARIYSTAVDWQPDAALALLEWVQGTPLRDYTAVLELYAEELGETDVEALLLTWIGDLCGALAKFHEIGLVHGDVSLGT